MILPKMLSGPFQGIPQGTGSIPDPQTFTGFPPPVAQPVVGTPPVQMFTQADLDAERERVRNEEKNKLYGTIEELKQQTATLLEDNKTRQAAEEEAQRRAQEVAAAATRAAEEQELTALQLVQKRQKEWEDQLALTQQSWETQLQEERQSRLEAQAILDKEREFNGLREYIQSQVQSNQETIAPELVDLIQGNTREEVDASVARLVDKTNQILANLGQVSQQQQNPQAVPVAPGVRPTGGPANLDPMSQYQQLTPQQIAGMSMAEYAKNRSQLIGAAGSQQNKGLYG